MKKFIFVMAMMMVTSVSYAKVYVCTGYTDGVKVAEAIKVNATKVPIAEEKAADRMRKKGLEVDFVQCK